MSDANPLFGELLVQLGLVTRLQLQEALSLQSLTTQRVGEALVSLGYVTRGQLQTALLKSLGLTDATAAERPPLGELLVGLKHVSLEQVEECLERQKRDGRRLGEILVERGYCTYKHIYEALSLQTKGSARSKPAAKPGNVRVMVVDDSPLARAFVEEGLKDKGYEVLCFEDAFAALENVSEVKPTIVLSDLEMPGMDGAELCRRLKDGPARAVPVIILTANDTESQKVGGLRAGADDYVNKSASMEELSARIESVLRRTGETERVRKLFVRYTSDAVVEEILKSNEEIVLTGEKREATMLFADIRNFTSLAESLPPETVVTILNEVLGGLSDAVLTCGGTLDKFLGDGLMAVFGAPVRRPDDTLRAMQAATMMMDAMATLNADRQRAFREGRVSEAPPVLELGIGINTGPVIAGNLGSQLRTEYTCIGDAVNVAARLCALAGPGEVLVGERTVALIGAGGKFEELPPVRLKGKSQPVPLFRAVLGEEPKHPVFGAI
ncbi:MAG: response regulator [Myxococcota bacterium]|nr:response regulator [Myxococcota bacterium]